MKKRYMVWWHSYINDINRETTTLKDLNKLILLEEQGKIKVKDTKTLNPIIIEILDESVKSEVVNNPFVDVDEVE